MSTLDVTNLKSKLALTPTKFYDKDDKEIGTLCRAWVNYNGTGTVAIRDSFNVSSITDNGTGDYTINFTNAMPDANYCSVFGSGRGAINADTFCVLYPSTTPKTTTSIRVLTGYISQPGSSTDMVFSEVAVFR